VRVAVRLGAEPATAAAAARAVAVAAGTFSVNVARGRAIGEEWRGAGARAYERVEVHGATAGRRVRRKRRRKEPEH
jgi:hypothetical protein